MQTILKGKDAEIEMLKREVAELKKNSDKKQRSLVDVESGERRYEALYERLLQEY
jgi:prefoldin subunit 5